MQHSPIVSEATPSALIGFVQDVPDDPQAPLASRPLGASRTIRDAKEAKVPTRPVAGLIRLLMHGAEFVRCPSYPQGVVGTVLRLAATVAHLSRTRINKLGVKGGSLFASSKLRS